MKTSLIALAVCSLALVGCTKKDDSATLADKTKVAAENAADKTKEVAGNVADKTKEVAIDVKNSISNKITEWKLTPADIKADLEKGGRVVRSKTATAADKVGTAVDNARVVTVINAKLVADRDLSAWKIDVDADNGTVTLKGTVSSPEFLGKAVALALDTDGVNQVISLLTVQ